MATVSLQGRYLLQPDMYVEGKIISQAAQNRRKCGIQFCITVCPAELCEKVAKTGISYIKKPG